MAVTPEGPNANLTNTFSLYQKTQRIEQSLNDATLISSDLDTDYLPLYAMFIGRHIALGNELRYTTYWLDPSIAIAKSVSFVIPAFNAFIKPIEFVKENITYYIQKHCIYTISEGKTIVLFCTVVKKDYWRSIQDNFEIDKNQFLMVVNSEFMTPRYKAFYTYFTRYIMNPLLASVEIDFILTSDITKYCFKPIEVPLQFTTIVEMQTYLKSISDGAKNRFLRG